MGLADDVAYVAILFASIGFGKLFRLVPPQGERGVKSFTLRRYVREHIQANRIVYLGLCQMS